MSDWLAVDDDSEGQYFSCALEKEFMVVAD